MILLPSHSSYHRLDQRRFNWSEICDRVDLVGVVTGLLGPHLKRQGRILLWLCPFHNDHNPSFQVDPDRRSWKCWPCNLGGNAPALVMKRDGVSFPEAVRIVAELSGLVSPSGTPAYMRLRSPHGQAKR